MLLLLDILKGNKFINFLLKLFFQLDIFLSKLIFPLFVEHDNFLKGLQFFEHHVISLSTVLLAFLKLVVDIVGLFPKLCYFSPKKSVFFHDTEESVLLFLLPEVFEYFIDPLHFEFLQGIHIELGKGLVRGERIGQGCNFELESMESTVVVLTKGFAESLPAHGV